MSYRKYRYFTDRQKNITLTVIAVAASAIVFLGLRLEGYTATAAPNDTPTPENTAYALSLIANDNVNPYDISLDTMPGNGCLRMPSRGVGGYLAKVFNDSNYVHYAEAEKIGITPITDEKILRDPGAPLVRVKSTPQYYVADLSHSFPYLIPLAEERLREVGQRFNDSLAARGGGDYRLKVTSLLRTSGSVKRLRRVNRASVDSSVHRFGTTFDISYTRFMLDRMGGTYRTQEDLKNLLAEILFAMRQEGKLYVKYEKFSGCFHITARRKEGDS